MSEFFPPPTGLPEGYVQVAAGGYEMVLYRGFVRVARVTPRGEAAVPLYEQQVRYDVPDRWPPAARSNVVLRGGAHGRDVHLQLVNEPQDPATYKGPIGMVRVQLGTPGPGGPVNDHPELVRIVRGEDQVVRIEVVLREAGASLATSGDGVPVDGSPPPPEPTEPPPPLEPDEPGSTTEWWEMEDNASTCPLDC